MKKPIVKEEVLINPGELIIGQCYFVRGPADHWVGKLAAIQGPFSLTLVEAAWVASSGRLHQFIRDGRADNMEIEPVGEITIPLGFPPFSWMAVMAARIAS